jgi:hypothetical protein
MKMTNIYILYKDNIPFYVGKTNNINIREYYHKKSFGENIILEIIDKVDINKWEFWETYYISLFKSWGFILENKNNGGGGTTKHSINAIQKISKANIGKPKPKSEITKQKMRKAKTNKQRNNCFWLYLPDRANKISNTRTNKPHPKKHTPVCQYDINGVFIKEFISANEASKAVGVTDGRIRAAARGVQQTSGGFIWKYKK